MFGWRWELLLVVAWLSDGIENGCVLMVRSEEDNEWGEGTGLGRLLEVHSKKKKGKAEIGLWGTTAVGLEWGRLVMVVPC